MGINQKVLRTAVIGLGRIGWQYHLPQIMTNVGFELVAVVDPLVERVDEARVKYGVKGYTDYMEMLRQQTPDLVVVASPTKFHCKQVCDIFEFGVDVFCEKPVALTVAEMDEMLAAMKRFGRKFMVYQPYRGNSELMCLRHILEQNLIGDVYMIKRSFSRYSRRDDWQAFAANGGGMLYNYGSHFIDQLLCLTGFDISYMKCFVDTIATLGDAEDVVKVLFKTETGIILDLDINCASALSMTPWHILGKNGSIVLDFDSKKMEVKYFVPESLQPLEANPQLAAEGRRYCNSPDISWKTAEYDIADFKPIDYYDKCYDYFALGKEAFVPIWQSRELVRIIEDFRESV